MNLTDTTMDASERELAGLESLVARVRARQMVLLMDRRQAPTADGCRSLVEWTTGRLDVAPETATAPVRTARALVDHSTVATAVASGEISFDRTVECSQLATLRTEDPVGHRQASSSTRSAPTASTGRTRTRR